MSDCVSIFDARPNLHFPISLPGRSCRASHVRAPITKNREDRNNPGRRIREPVKLIKAQASELRGTEARGRERDFRRTGGKTLTSSVGLLSLLFREKGEGTFVENAAFRTRKIASGCYFITSFAEKENERDREKERKKRGGEREPAPSLTGPIANLAPSKLL